MKPITKTSSSKCKLAFETATCGLPPPALLLFYSFLHGINSNRQHHRLSKTVTQPVLFIQGKYDAVLKPSMSVGMEKYIPKLTRAEVKAGHWALWQKAADVNALVKAWLETEVLGGGQSSKL